MLVIEAGHLGSAVRTIMARLLNQVKYLLGQGLISDRESYASLIVT